MLGIQKVKGAIPIRITQVTTQTPLDLSSYCILSSSGKRTEYPISVPL